MNEMIKLDPQKPCPCVSESAWISETAVIMGNVTIGDDVFVAPNAVIRADEPGSSIVIASGSNVQDNVVVHALSHSRVMIGGSTSLAHGCIVHGPCHIGEGCFIGFGAVVFDCILGDDTVVLHNATVRGVELLPGKVVQDGDTIIKQKMAGSLKDITQDLAEFKKRVLDVNINLVKDHRMQRIHEY